MNRRVFVDIYNDIQMPCRFGSSFFIGVSTRTGLEICAYPFVGLDHNARIILVYESSDNPAGRGRVYGAAAIVIIIVIPILPPAYSARRRQIHVFNIADRIPLTGIQSHARQRISIKPRIDINRMVSCACRDLRLIPDAGNPIRQRPTGSRLTSISAVIRMDIKRFTLSLIVLSSCFISKRHYPCFQNDQSESAAKRCAASRKRFGKNGRVIPARRFPPPRRALRVQPPRVRRPQASARSGQRGDSSN